MRVRDIMTSQVTTCSPDTSLAAAADLMWKGDCGVLPVLQDGKLTGVVTDRDMYIALGTRNVPAAQVQVGEVATSPVFTCAPDDDVHAALATMKNARVRRLPVVGFGGTVLGILSIDDLVLAAGASKAMRNAEVIDALQAICPHHHPLARIVAM